MANEKWETVRRLRYGALLKLFRHRWGHILPDDDSGRGDLWELLTNVSLAPSGADKKMRLVIEVWAPWMPAEEADDLLEHVKRLTRHERTPTAKQLGERLRVTNSERERLRLWPIAPIDKSADELLVQQKAKERSRRARKRVESGIRTREAYLAELSKRSKPWEVEGLPRSTWYRRKRKALDGVCPDMRRGEVETIVSKRRLHLVQPQKGIQEVASLPQSTTEVSVTEGDGSSSQALRTDPIPSDPRMRALGRWGSLARGKQLWAKPTILSNEPRDFVAYPSEQRRAS